MCMEIESEVVMLNHRACHWHGWFAMGAIDIGEGGAEYTHNSHSTCWLAVEEYPALLH